MRVLRSGLTTIVLDINSLLWFAKSLLRHARLNIQHLIYLNQAISQFHTGTVRQRSALEWNARCVRIFYPIATFHHVESPPLVVAILQYTDYACHGISRAISTTKIGIKLYVPNVQWSYNTKTFGTSLIQDL